MHKLQKWINPNTIEKSDKIYWILLYTQQQTNDEDWEYIDNNDIIQEEEKQNKIWDFISYMYSHLNSNKR